VLLSASANVSLNKTAVPSSLQLTYPYRKPIIITEIRWVMKATNAATLALGAAIWTKLQIGRYYLMRDFVPVWLLSPLMDLGVNANSEDETYDSASGQAFSAYRWRLPEPLYVEAGQVLQSTFQRVDPNSLGVPAGDITVQVTYAGYTVPTSAPLPRVIAVPYVAPWVTTFGNGYQQSNEYNLFNPFDKEIKVQRITARVLNAQIGAFDLKQALTPASTTTPGSFVSTMQIQMFDSWGGKMVNDLTGPNDVADAPRCAWTVDTILPPKGQYDVRAFNMVSTEQLHMAIIGTRDELL
jgi:hypothetical protein